MQSWIDDLDPNYGPPPSVLNRYICSKAAYLDSCRETFSEAKTPMTIPLVIQLTKIEYDYRKKPLLEYLPKVGHLVAEDNSGYGNGSKRPWVVTKVYYSKTTGQPNKVDIAPITFMTHSTVTYDLSGRSHSLKLNKDGWHSMFFSYGRFTFYDPGFDK